MRIPLRLALLPPADAIAPYLAEIDRNRWYSNQGPLLRSLEARMAERFGVETEAVTITANATAGLTAVLRAFDRQEGRACVMPALTFTASPLAARAAGMRPAFADVDPKTLMLTPESVATLIESLGGPSEIGAVMPVSLYGAPLDVAAWEAFHTRTGIPVVIDAAWCFDHIEICDLPCVISFHATKAFGAGEGGMVISRNPTLGDRVLRGATTFGLSAQRQSIIAGSNGKMSEYGAAVGHAALDIWPQRRPAILQVARAYADALADVPGVHIANDVDGSWAPGTILVRFDEAKSDYISSVMTQRGIETRHWWGNLCTDHPAHADSTVGDLTVSRDVVHRLINLPFFDDLETDEINEVVSLIRELSGPKYASSEINPGATN